MQRNEVIQIRVSLEEKRSMQTAAQSSGVSLSEWARKRLMFGFGGVHGRSLTAMSLDVLEAPLPLTETQLLETEEVHKTYVRPALARLGTLR